MNKALFALSLLVVAPMVKASDVAPATDTTSAPVSTSVTEVAAAVVPAPVVEAVQAAVSAPVETVATVVAAPVETAAAVVAAPAAVVESTPAPVVPAAKGIFAKGSEKVSNGVASIKNGTVNGVVFIKDGLVCVYDKVTGKIEAFTPQMILNARDSIRGTIANYPLTAVALSAFVAVQASNYFSAPSEAAEDQEDSF